MVRSPGFIRLRYNIIGIMTVSKYILIIRFYLQTRMSLQQQRSYGQAKDSSVWELQDKSEHGGSTNLSEGSVESIDEDLQVKKGDKFEFINEEAKVWPQWSVQQDQKQVAKDIALQELIKQMNDDDFMFNRGVTWPVNRVKKQQATSATLPSKQKKSGIIDKLRNWWK